MLTVNYPEKNIGPSAGTKWQGKSIFCLILVILNDQNKLIKTVKFVKPEVLKELEIGGNWREINYIGGFSI